LSATIDRTLALHSCPADCTDHDAASWHAFRATSDGKLPVQSLEAWVRRMRESREGAGYYVPDDHEPEGDGTLRDLAVLEASPNGTPPDDEPDPEIAAARDEDPPGARTRRFSKITEGPVEWLAKPVIPWGTVTMLVGFSGYGTTCVGVTSERG
jgi:hypothetical protein